MSVFELKKKVESLTQSIDDQKSALDILRQQIVDAVKPFAKDKLKSTVENQVRSQPEHTKELGKESLAKMKKQLVELLDNSSMVVDNVFSDNSLWMHVNYKIDPNGDPYGQGYNNKNTANSLIHKGIKIIIGEAGKILIDYHYLTVGSEYIWESGVHYDYTRTKKGTPKLMYRYGLSLPQNISRLIDEYCTGIRTLHDTSSQLLDSQKALSQQEAEDLWNEV